MITEEFTPQTGIEVDLSLMPDQTKLVLANASGDSPDVATGVNYSIPFELGIRGALKDLTQFDDFAEVAGRYTEGLLMPYVIDDSVYAIPETMNFQVLFYRKDILDKLGLEVRPASFSYLFSNRKKPGMPGFLYVLIEARRLRRT